MGAGTLTIYSASAGSGKTYNLALAYLQRLFASRYSYRKILAVTFTHKATAEMKSRILDELNNLASGADSRYLTSLVGFTGKAETVIRREAKEILFAILHDYSRFSVSTIDSFFQRILRAFARDIGLHSGFDIELDHTTVLASAVDRMMSSAATDKDLRKWLTGYVRANIDDEKTWDIRQSVIDLSNQLFSEKFRLLSNEEKTKLQDKDFLSSYIKDMRAIATAFVANLKERGEKCLELLLRFDLKDEIFYYKARGVPGFVRSLAEGVPKAPNSYVRGIEANPPKWCTGAVPAALSAAIGAGLDENVREAIHYYDGNILDYNTANTILSNIYTLGILTDVLSQVRKITRDENIFLLSDTGELIYLITGKDQTPFIYEKVGNAFESFMIDEFQDTSAIQWKNFSILIGNSMAQGFDNLVVGDIKQSIYRWRNSNWETLYDLRNSVDNKRLLSKPLETNWRSGSNIIKFNNSLFSIIPHLLDLEFSGKGMKSGFSELYSEACQLDPEKKKGGFVRISFVDCAGGIELQDNVLELLPELIRSILQKGYSPSDIGILVRDNREGAAVLRKIISYSSALPEEEKSSFNIVSNDSLLLVNAPVINFITAVLQVLDNPNDMIGCALMLRYYLLATGNGNVESVPLESRNLKSISSGYFPSDYEDFLEGIRYLTLWDITERTIKFFNLGSYSFNVPFLNSFQDIIISFASGKNQGIPSFLEWWQSEGGKKSVSLPGQQDAIKVLTIHKSKGLQFGIVILPFISWNLDHKSLQSNILWVKPDSPPFDKLGMVPVRYKSDLSETIFSGDYYNEKYSAFIDNINLLYVAMTRAQDGIFGFAPGLPGSDNRIAAVLKEAIEFRDEIPGGETPFLYNYFDEKTKVFEFGKHPVREIHAANGVSIPVSTYNVSSDIESLKLKLHWENYLGYDSSGKRMKIDYGRTMHEIFEEILTPDDVRSAVRRKVIDGKLPGDEEAALCEKISAKIRLPGIREWFDAGNEVIREASILLPGAGTRRPDRIILRDGKTIIVDFKFGAESPQHLSQIRHYKHLLSEMGYTDVESFLWYADSEKIVSG